MSEIDEEIDLLANSVVHGTTGQVFPTTIVPFTELTAPQRSDLERWRFKWREEAKRKGRDVVALLAEGSGAVQGLMSLEPAEGFVLVHLLESAPHNVGQNKLFRGVPGNLFAFACARSFASKFDGYVGFDAKTELIEHYKVTLGAEQVGSSSRMVIAAENSLQLVEQYYKESDQWPL
ncbi:MAG: hypothetical protein KY475_12520 [Planctomycetes bacterium]|nr:hypothetical protein [Planctomycetota bacterium]